MTSSPALLHWFLREPPPGFPVSLTAPLWNLTSRFAANLHSSTPSTSSSSSSAGTRTGSSGQSRGGSGSGSGGSGGSSSSGGGGGGGGSSGGGGGGSSGSGGGGGGSSGSGSGGGGGGSSGGNERSVMSPIMDPAKEVLMLSDLLTASKAYLHHLSLAADNTNSAFLADIVDCQVAVLQKICFLLHKQDPPMGTPCMQQLLRNPALADAALSQLAGICGYAREELGRDIKAKKDPGARHKPTTSSSSSCKAAKGQAVAAAAAAAGGGASASASTPAGVGAGSGGGATAAGYCASAPAAGGAARSGGAAGTGSPTSFAKLVIPPDHGLVAVAGGAAAVAAHVKSAKLRMDLPPRSLLNKFGLYMQGPLRILRAMQDQEPRVITSTGEGRLACQTSYRVTLAFHVG